ncbi:SPOR domain-containing protein [Brucepastera parasyntrophica]|uniref:SPOR domain-containing protein n=1 Tax=Brucepastera parasyntrophica TaxID=2880008 RepID=UPI00210E17C4|nr:SPOR domain-containing protein [Brucepastera parasyntrophica]ULQ60091.1 SPOR domain-containing protein [Brucepastera parasyntrophica]
MKHKIGVFLIGCLLLCIPALSVWAVWEGNAGIAADYNFPKGGMYALSNMFPRNTIVEIQNLETNITVRAVITGTSDVPGLVALLSPETAAALNIRSGSVSRVRISVPSVVAERPADGTYANTTNTQNQDPDVNPAVAANTNPVIPLETVAEPETDPLVAYTDNPDESGTETVVIEADPIIGEETYVITEPEPDTQVAEIPDTENTDVPGEAIAEANPDESPAVSLTASEEVPEPGSDALNIYYDEPLVAIVETEPEPEEETVHVSASDEIPDPETTEITLVPVGPKPPEAVPDQEKDETIPVVQEIALGDKPSGEQTVEDPIPTVPEIIPPQKTTELAQQPIKQVDEIPGRPQAENSTGLKAIHIEEIYTSDISGLTISDLVKNRYYIQLASYSDVRNTLKVIDTYGKKYPLAVQNNADVMKVLVGPLDKTEYGAVLEHFKKDGFKDAFVRKGQ